MSGAAWPEAALWLLAALPVVTGTLLCLAGRRVDALAAATSLVVATATFGLALVVAVERPSVSRPFMLASSLGLGVDGLAAITVVTVTAVALLVLAVAARQPGEAGAAPARFHGLMLLFLAAVVITVTATTLPTLLLAWEVMGATSYALIGFVWRDGARVTAGRTAFLTTRAADLGLYAAVAAALAGGAGLGLADLAAAAPGWRDVVAGGVLVAALGKAAQLPFSVWLSAAMQGPSPVSALLHSATMVAMGGYLLLRTAGLLAATGWAATAAAWIGALTALALGVVALAQRDLKQLLAASTAAQLGFVVLAAGVDAIAAGTAQLVAHASTKALLFLGAGLWLDALGTRSLAALTGAARRWRLLGLTMTVGAIALAGAAPLSLWATKDAVLTAVREVSPALYAVGLAAAALSAAYAGKVLVLVLRTIPAGAEDAYDDERPGTRRVDRLAQAPLVLLAAGAAALGVLALPPLAGSVQELVGGVAVPVDGAGLAVSAVLAVVVLGLVAWLVRGHRLPEPSWAGRWLGLATATRVVVVQPVYALAAGLARFDDSVLDAAVEATARSGLRMALRAARIDAVVDGGVGAVARGARRLGDLARRPQTGQLHDYYLVVAGGLAAAALVVLVTR